MNRKWIPYFIILGLAIVLFFVRRCGQLEQERSTVAKTEFGVNRNRGFDRRVNYLEYTRHARCRMECRKITQGEVEEIMKTGTINYKKSDVKARPCPEYALEGMTSDDQRVRIVFAQCDSKTKVVTVIDLGQDWQCDCPGDNKKSRK